MRWRGEEEKREREGRGQWKREIDIDRWNWGRSRFELERMKSRERGVELWPEAKTYSTTNQRPGLLQTTVSKTSREKQACLASLDPTAIMNVNKEQSYWHRFFHWTIVVLNAPELTQVCSIPDR